MVDNTVTSAVDDLMRELETVREALLMAGVDASDCNVGEVVYNAVQSVRAVTETIRNRREDRQQILTKVEEYYECPVTLLRIPLPMFLKPGQTSEEVDVSADRLAEIKRTQMSLLASLPCSSASEDKIVIQELLWMAIRFPDIRPLFGNKGAIDQILNPTTIQRSSSNDTLQGFMVELVFAISSFGNNDSKILHISPGAMPFLVACLTSQTAETRSVALRALSWLSLVVSNRKVIGESGAMKPLIDVIREKDSVGLRHAASVIFNLCKVGENGERAVSEGAVIAVMEMIRSRVLLNEMLEILEVLSGHKKAVVQMEENGVVECLFGVLGEMDVKQKDKEYCVSIVHGMCGDDVAKTRKLMNEMENARDILERVVSSGTAKAKEKAIELLWKLDLDGNLADYLDRMDIESCLMEI